MNFDYGEMRKWRNKLCETVFNSLNIFHELSPATKFDDDEYKNNFIQTTSNR